MRILETAWDGYRVLGGNGLPSEVGFAIETARDIESAAKRKVKKTLIRKVILVPVKFVYKAGKMIVWDMLVGSVVPIL